MSSIIKSKNPKFVLIYGNLLSPHTCYRGKIISNFIKVKYFSTKNLLDYKFAYRVWAPSFDNSRLTSLVLAIWVLIYSWFNPEVQVIFFSSDFRKSTRILSFCRNFSVICMGSDLIEPKADWHDSAIKGLLSRAKKIAYKSSNLGKVITSLGYEFKAHQVMWGVEIPEVSQLPQKRNVIISHRGCMPFYRNELILEAFADLLMQPEIPVDLSLEILLGNFHDETYLSQLRRHVEILGLSRRVRFLPRMAQQDVLAIFLRSKVAVSMPISDGYPNSIFETAFARCTHVLPDFEQFYDVLDVMGSLVLTKVDVKSLSQSMLEAIRLEPPQVFDAKEFNERQLKIVERFLGF